MSNSNAKKVEITDVILRDAHQSLIATRMDNAPASLCTRAVIPSASPKASASNGCSVIVGSAALAAMRGSLS